MSQTEEKKDYKSTLNLPRTDYPMRGNLNNNEPQRVKKWEDAGLFEKMKARNEGKPTFHLHDGPPYANGNIHMGHALNKTLKDFIVRYKGMRGFHTEFVPGWDCHGLPIEQKVIQHIAKKKLKVDGAIDIRRMCEDYAEKYLDVQRDEFKRLLCIGQWDDPYVTMNPKYEAGVLKVLRSMVEKGYIYKGQKPVYWDFVFETALAEAEIEYHDHESHSIYVKFPIKDHQDHDLLKDLVNPSIVIWTTTPWTLPANLAVCLHPDFDYVALQNCTDTYIVAEGLAEDFIAACDLKDIKQVAKFKAGPLEHLRCAHPMFDDKDSLVILGEHVTLEQGTGCVHTAPGHGEDDFIIGMKYKLPILVPVDEKGRFTDEFPLMQGENVFKANPKIVDFLREKGVLLAHGMFKHSYPFSWRSKKPILFRVTEQWFMNVDADDLRKRALEEIDKVQWIPTWGRERIFNMVDGRPDWCLSRQRSWGVPIPSLYSKKARRSILTTEILDNFISLVESEGTDCWYERPVEDFVPEGFTCPISGGSDFEKEYNVLDVWFDSGSSWKATSEQHAELTFPADLYLEGSDQHRGWFQHALWTRMGVHGDAPFKAVLTHGFVLDEKGNPMSKSLGNVIPPQKVIEQYGADVLRLWVASTDYRSDVAISQNILKQVSEAYRRIRNTFRFLLGNLSDFDPKVDAVTPVDMGELDRWALYQLSTLIERVTKAFDNYEFHKVYHLTSQFCVVEMSALYLDIVKDRLYCEGPADSKRRSTQTVLYHLVSALARLVAPVLPHTADEVWESAGFEPESVHLTDYPDVPAEWQDFPEREDWDRLLGVREIVARHLEQLRRDKTIGLGLDAAVTLKVESDTLYVLLDRYRSDLAELFIVSQCTIEKVDKLPEANVDNDSNARDLKLSVEVKKAEGNKCNRCWMITPEAGQSPDFSDVCPRCEGVLRRYW